MYHLSMEVSDYFSTKDHFIVEDLFNFPNVDDADLNGPIDNGNTSAVKGNVAESPTLTGGESFTSSLSSYGHHFSTDFPEPCEEVAELEWLSNFMEDCFSNKDHQQYFSSSSSSSTTSTPAQIPTMPSVPAKTRSKRSRANPTNWASRRLPILPHQPAAVAAAAPQQDSAGEAATVRRCLHCGSDKTPQWRMGPLGPKTLCNACGVRYKSGRLVPEYRPAASPTFMVSEHSNSHRKVVELRRQKELQQKKMMFWSSAN